MGSREGVLALMLSTLLLMVFFFSGPISGQMRPDGQIRPRCAFSHLRGIFSPEWDRREHDVDLVCTFPQPVRLADIGQATVALSGTMDMRVGRHPSVPNIRNVCDPIISRNGYTTHTAAQHGYRVTAGGQDFPLDNITIFETYEGYGTFDLNAPHGIQINDVTEAVRRIVQASGDAHSITIPFVFAHTPCTLSAFRISASPPVLTIRPPSSPTIASVSPTSATRGQTISNFTVNGHNFGESPTLSFSGAGITVNSYGERTPTRITANITIARDAADGMRDVVVTHDNGVAARLRIN